MSKAQENRVIIVVVRSNPLEEWELEELTNLVKSAGYTISASFFQKRNSPDKAYYVGKGKLEEIVKMAKEVNAKKIVFDNELKAVHFSNLEKALEIEVVDRTMLIIEIFSRNALSLEGKLQVELMYMKKMLPRLVGKGLYLSQQAGGGAGGGGARRGGGEQQKELDRRTIQTDILKLEQRLGKLSQERALRRKRREQNRCFTISLVGYTNSGKSTLMNSLTSANVLAKDDLFVTLDPISRRITSLYENEVLLIDTVGFISRLPHDFVNAFKSTLEETLSSDLILHIVDGSSPVAYEQFSVVNDVLASIGADSIPCITVINKMDVGFPNFIPRSKHLAVVSAKTGENMSNLSSMIKSFIEISKDACLE